MEESVQLENDEEPNRIATLVFMDLESTGLPCDVGSRNVHITEMSLVAVDRNNFEGDRNLRVLNKISLCIRPRAVISPGSMGITGLYNDILENQEEFDDSVPKLLEYFFRRLQKPICLLAHNGNRFDFPVLQAELKRLSYSLGPDIVCADTLLAFRSICQTTKKKMEAEKKTKQEIAQQCENVPITDDDIDNLLLEDLASFSQIDVTLTEIGALGPGLSEGNSESKLKDMLSPTQSEKTPKKDPISENQNSFNIPRKRKILDPTYLPYNDYKKRVVPAKRTLFPEPAQNTSFSDHDTSKPEVQNITKFSLVELYKFFFNKTPPNSHYAEIDTISLIKVCQKINKDFLHWVDENHVEFSIINSLW